MFFWSLGLLFQQSDLWQHVSADPGPSGLRDTTRSPEQLGMVRRALAARVQSDNWPCAQGEEPDWADKVTFYDLPVSKTDEVLLVQAGAGCARGGQGANGAMWLVHFKNGKPIFLATPQQKFNGWLYSIQPSTSHGYRDVVLGWHMNAGEADLTYFRFDGTSYQVRGRAQLLTGDGGVVRIVPIPAEATRPQSRK
jgi:hypothetical protein